MNKCSSQHVTMNPCTSVTLSISAGAWKRSINGTRGGCQKIWFLALSLPWNRCMALGKLPLLASKPSSMKRESCTKWLLKSLLVLWVLCGGESWEERFPRAKISGFYHITKPRIIPSFAPIMPFLSHTFSYTPLGNKMRKKENLLLHAKNRSASGKGLG